MWILSVYLSFLSEKDDSFDGYFYIDGHLHLGALSFDF